MHLILPIFLFIIAMIIPSLAVIARRLHDIGRNGWYALSKAQSIIGIIPLLKAFFQDSQPGTNEYMAITQKKINYPPYKFSI